MTFHKKNAIINMVILYMQLDCGPSWFLKVLLFFNEILNIVHIIVPIGLIILMMFDLSKATVQNDSDKMDSAAKVAVKRLLMAVMIFVVPTIVSIFINVLGDLGVDSTTCLNTTPEQIKALEAKEEAKKKEEKTKEGEERKKKKEEKNEGGSSNETSTNPSPSSGNSIKINGSDIVAVKASGCDGVVYYENGTFYRPSSNTISPGTSATKPTRYGSGNTVYYYNKYFYSNLSKLIDAATKAGYKISMSTTLFGAWRPIEIQTYYYCCCSSCGYSGTYTLPKEYGGQKCNGPGTCNGGNYASYPGSDYAYHGWGIASDLGGNGLAWAKQHAEEYGLTFPNSGEAWHISAKNVIVSDEKVKKCMK